MKNRNYFSLAVVTVLLFSLSTTSLASNKILRVSVLDSGEIEVPEGSQEADVAGAESFETLSAESAADEEEVPGVEVSEELISDAELIAAAQQEDVCGFDLPEEKTYNSQLIAIRKKLRVEPGETFRVKVFFKNTGTMPWFSNKSTCLGPKMSLGTDRDRDRESDFYGEDLQGWESPNRIGMDQFRADPGQIASFTFYAKAGDFRDIVKEYFTPVVKDIQWIESSQFSFDVMIGDTGENAGDLRKKMSYAYKSGSVNDIDLNAEKTLLVDLSEQNLYVKLGDYEIKKFRVSTGASDTPTPVGETKIILKQEIRVGVKAPHYIMPKYMMFRAGGYGFHSLPSLGRAHSGVFWTEARSHIGIPVSHGCVRMLPEDSAWVYDFTDIGTKVVVQR